MLKLEDQTRLYTPETSIFNLNGRSLIIDPHGPNWINTDARGGQIFSYLDGKTTFRDVVARYSRESGEDFASAWIHCHDFIRDAWRHGMARDKPFVYPHYQGRGNVLIQDKLEEIWFQTNNSCNLSCAHCLVSSGPGGAPGMSSGDLQQLVREARELGAQRFFITGGEPLLRKDFWETADRIIHGGAILHVLTNGTLFKGRMLEKAKGYPREQLLFQVSLDGSRPEINDPIRGQGSFAGIVQGIKNATAAGIVPTLTTTITQGNLEDVTGITRLAAELGLHNHHLLWLHKRGRAARAMHGMAPDIDRLIQVVEEARLLGEKLGVSIDNFESLKVRLSGPRLAKYDLAVAGWSSVCVNYDGHVYPSAAFAGIPALDMGNALTGSIEEAWRHSEVAHRLRGITVERKARCHTCHLKFLCGGGDIEHTYFHSQGVYGGDPMLGIDPYCELYQSMIQTTMMEMGKGVHGYHRPGTNGTPARNTGIRTPRIHYGMGDTNLCDAPAVNGHLPAHPERLNVRTLHSNCVLSFDLDHSRQPIRDFYAHAAEEPQKELCCPVRYDPSLVHHIPREVLDVFYGCGGPMSIADIHEGETVVDLGSGGGIDCFIAAKRVGASGRVIGIDMTDQMLAIAQSNQEKVAANLGYDNTEFRKGFLEEVPVTAESVDLVTSNCVINLSPDKRRVFEEIWRMLKNQGRFVISDIVTEKPLPHHLATNPQLVGECIGRALTEETLLSYLEEAGFYGITILKKIFWQHVEEYKVYSVTVTGYKFQKQGECRFLGHKAVYHGPFKSVMDEEGHLYPRNIPVNICTDTAEKLSKPPYSPFFTITQADGTVQSACCGGEASCC